MFKFVVRHLALVAQAALIATLILPWQSHAAGFRSLQLADPGDKDLQVGLWYPSSELPPAEPNTEFGLSVAHDAPIANANGGLILISHGFSGWYAGHADTAAALADAGYVVAAPSHTGNTWSDMSSSLDQWMIDRPRHISRVIDQLLTDEHLSPVIDPAKIGVYGFSAGGYTAIGLIGGIPDLTLADRHCADHPQEFVCAEGMIDQIKAKRMDKLPADAWGADPRIKAAVIAAPGFGFAYSQKSLENVSAVVQLWSGERDSSVPTETNAALLKARLPNPPEAHWVDKAGHFAFLVMPCREAFRQADPEEYALICGDAEGFDRYAFHDEMHIEMVRFFDKAFK